MVRYLKRLKFSRLGRVQAFPMYGGLGMSAPSLHRESTDSLSGNTFLPQSSNATCLAQETGRKTFRSDCNAYMYIYKHAALSFLGGIRLVQWLRPSWQGSTIPSAFDEPLHLRLPFLVFNSKYTCT